MSSPAIPSTQRVWRITGDKASLAAGLKLHDNVPVAKPARGQVLVRVRAVSLNYRDLLVAKGTYPMALQPNVIPASDGAGEVAAVGEDVKEWKVGDRVAAIFTPAFQGGSLRFHKGLQGSLGGDLDGMLAQYVVLDATALVPLPKELSFEQAATLPCAGVTAYNALYNGPNPLRAGHTVLVEGTGGVSVLAAQLALAAGARVIGTSSSDEKLKRMHALGVAKEDLINYKTTPEWGKKVRELTNGLGVDHVIEVGGPSTIQQAVSATRFAGEVAVIGFVGGPAGEGLNPMTILSGGLSVRGILVGSREQFLRLLEHIAQNKLQPVVDKTFPFEQAVKAYEFVEAAQHFGKAVITIE